MKYFSFDIFLLHIQNVHFENDLLKTEIPCNSDENEYLEIVKSEPNPADIIADQLHEHEIWDSAPSKIMGDDDGGEGVDVFFSDNNNDVDDDDDDSTEEEVVTVLKKPTRKTTNKQQNRRGRRKIKSDVESDDNEQNNKSSDEDFFKSMVR